MWFSTSKRSYVYNKYVCVGYDPSRGRMSSLHSSFYKHAMPSGLFEYSSAGDERLGDAQPRNAHQNAKTPLCDRNPSRWIAKPLHFSLNPSIFLSFRHTIRNCKHISLQKHRVEVHCKHISLNRMNIFIDCNHVLSYCSNYCEHCSYYFRYRSNYL